jgi:hypothetical protein
MDQFKGCPLPLLAMGALALKALFDGFKRFVKGSAVGVFREQCGVAKTGQQFIDGRCGKIKREHRRCFFRKMMREARILPRQIPDQCTDIAGRKAQKGEFFAGQLPVAASELLNQSRVTFGAKQ